MVKLFDYFVGEFKSTADYQYQLLRCNVDLLKIIQLGLTFLDETGKLPETGPSTWQFNFKFNLTEDMYAEDSVDLLQVRTEKPFTILKHEICQHMHEKEKYSDIS